MTHGLNKILNWEQQNKSNIPTTEPNTPAIIVLMISKYKPEGSTSDALTPDPVHPDLGNNVISPGLRSHLCSVEFHLTKTNKKIYINISNTNLGLK